ncbi:uncharacterized protein LOC118647812 [Monomorium pharaonis]|uniref:uncharacterized protein LOC118647812 n=1 Tax=Monomorium pharaonis TaxID=307658 RepID=UPI0017469E08|nr:uncharacterized protein LOC118647812 [Monomorium pharaonis]
MWKNTRKLLLQVEQEIDVHLKLKCLLHVDENTGKPVSKELTAINCEPMIIVPREKSEDSSADIFDKANSSPDSVYSNPQLYALTPAISRTSDLSSISSFSSASSTALLKALLSPRKYAKKYFSQNTNRQMLTNTYDHLTREWKNHRLLTETILNYTNAELSSITTIPGATSSPVVDIENVSNERLDDPHPYYQLTVKSDNMRPSTLVEQPATTSKVEPVTDSTRKGKAVKRPSSKQVKSDVDVQIDIENDGKISDKPHASESDAPSRAKKSKPAEQDDALNKDKPRSKRLDALLLLTSGSSSCICKSESSESTESVGSDISSDST